MDVASEAIRATRSVLVLDDDADIRSLVTESLTEHGYRVIEADSAASGRALVATAQPDVVILDLTLPDGSGLDVLRELNERPDVRVIVLSALTEEGDRVAGLELGADDYVTKPFLCRELVARVNAVLRRSDHAAAPSSAKRFGALTIDTASKQALLDGRDIGLTSREFSLLEYLASSPRTVYSTTQLLDHVWGSDVQWKSPATVSEHIHRIRAKLETDPRNPRWIVTMRNMGYRFEPARPED